MFLDIADQPVAALAAAVGEIVAAHRLGIARETVRQFGGVARHRHAAARSATRDERIALHHRGEDRRARSRRSGTNIRSFQEMISGNRP